MVARMPTASLITTVPPNVNQFSHGWTVLGKEAVSGSGLQDGLESSRQ